MAVRMKRSGHILGEMEQYFIKKIGHVLEMALKSNLNDEVSATLEAVALTMKSLLNSEDSSSC